MDFNLICMSENRKNISMNRLLIILLAILFHLTACNDLDLNDLYTIIDTENEKDLKVLPSINYEDNELKGTVAYKICSIEGVNDVEPVFSGIQIIQGKAFLFKDYIPDEMKDEMSKCVVFLFDSNTGKTELSLIKSDWGVPIYGSICNFPEYATKWDIPKNGTAVNFKGISYASIYGGLANITQIDYVLTNLKR